MKTKTGMIRGYVIGGLIFLVVIPFSLFLATKSTDNLFQLKLLASDLLKWIIAAVLLMFGLVFAIWSLIIQYTVGKGGPLEGANIEISPKTKHLVVTGPYKYTRNPMLLGTFALYLAISVSINSITSLILVLLFIIFMITVVVRKEEGRLQKDFGSEYDEYRKNVSMIIPWFHKCGLPLIQ